MKIRTILKVVGSLVLISATGAGWLVSASMLFVWAGGLGAHFPKPYWTWLLYARQPHIDKWTQLYLAGSGLVSALAIVFILFIFFWAFGPSRSLRRPFGKALNPIERGVTNNHGNAAWAPDRDLANRFGGSGCLIGASDLTPNAKLWFDDLKTGPGHSIIIAGPGAGKTTTAINRLWNFKGPRVVFDPSCEIGPIMTPALIAEGFNVTSIGLNGSGVNVLDWIDIRHPEADAHIRSVVDWIYDEGAASKGDQSRDPFWPMWGRKLVTCLMAHMLFSPDDQLPKTLATLRIGMSMPEDDMQVLLRGIHATSASAMARDIAGGLMGMKADETFSSIYSNAFAATEWLSVGVYADAVSGSAINTAAVLNSNTVVFIQIPLRTLLATPAVGRAVLGAFFNAMFHADGVGIEDTILFQIDEAWILGPLKEIKLCHTTARKYRGAVSTIFQSEGQIESVWGKEDAKMLRDTVSWRSYNAVQDGSVAEQLSRDLGEHAVLAWSESANKGRSRAPNSWTASRSDGDSVSQHELKRRLIKADEILRAPADMMFVLVRDFPYPIRCFSAPYFRYPLLNGLMGKNRFVRENVAAE